MYSVVSAREVSFLAVGPAASRATLQATFPRRTTSWDGRDPMTTLDDAIATGFVYDFDIVGEEVVSISRLGSRIL